MKKILNSINFFDMLIGAFCSFCITNKIYSFLYPKIGYSNLSDFWAGTSIFQNHNKNLDLNIFFVYILAFLILVPLIALIRKGINLSFIEKIKTKFKNLLNPPPPTELVF